MFGEGQTVTAPGTLLSNVDIHSGINHPEGLAVVNTCVTQPGQAGGCNPTGLLSHTVVPQKGHQNASPALVESVCVVPVDPRVTYPGNPATWSCNGKPLLVNSVCPGFDTTATQDMFIPGYMCGKSGDNGA